MEIKPFPTGLNVMTQIELRGWIFGLRMQIQGVKDKLPEDTMAGAELDVAQQIITRIEDIIRR